MNKNIGFLLLALCSATALHAMDSDFLPTALESATVPQDYSKLSAWVANHPKVTTGIGALTGAGLGILTRNNQLAKKMSLIGASCLTIPAALFSTAIAGTAIYMGLEASQKQCEVKGYKRCAKYLHVAQCLSPLCIVPAVSYSPVAAMQWLAKDTLISAGTRGAILALFFVGDTSKNPSQAIVKEVKSVISVQTPQTGVVPSE